jgi:hypothetical protein
MKTSLKAIAPFVCSGLAIMALATFNVFSPSSSASAGGFGLLVGNVRPCAAMRFDAQPDEPLIVILTRGNKTYETYDVSADSGTTWYHFDVPAGRYTLSTTWWGSTEYSVLVRFGRTSHVNFEVSCGAFSN